LNELGAEFEHRGDDYTTSQCASYCDYNDWASICQFEYTRKPRGKCFKVKYGYRPETVTGGGDNDGLCYVKTNSEMQVAAPRSKVMAPRSKVTAPRSEQAVGGEWQKGKCMQHTWGRGQYLNELGAEFEHRGDDYTTSQCASYCDYNDWASICQFEYTRKPRGKCFKVKYGYRPETVTGGGDNDGLCYVKK